MSNVIKLAGNIEEMEEYEPLPDGPYPAELQDIEIRYSEKQPSGYLYCKLRVQPDDFPADYDAGNAPDGLDLIYARVTIPDGANRRAVKPFKDFVRALGGDPAGTDFDFDSFVGSRVSILVKRQEYQGSVVNNIETLSALPQV